MPPIGDWTAGAFLKRLQAAAMADPERPVVFHIFRCLIVRYFHVLMQSDTPIPLALALVASIRQRLARK